MATRSPSAATGPAPTDAQIHERIVSALMDQRLVPGTRLAEDKLGQVFGVSRTRIRQVLIRLASEQLVTLVPNCGASVAQPTPAEAREVFGVRRLVEPPLLAAFIDAASPAALRGLKHWIDEEERLRAAGERRAAIRMAGAFHLHIAEHAGNATLERLLRELVSRTSLVLMSYGPHDLGEPPSCGCQDHRSLMAAVRLRDKSAAGRLMVAHLGRLEAQLVFDAPVPSTPDLADLLAV
jgi:DNA-binding GntR family transcriptional regulator